MLRTTKKSSFIVIVLAALVMLAATTALPALFGNGTVDRTSADVAALSPADLFVPVRDTTVKANVSTPDYAHADNGVLVTNSATGATVQYKNVIDVTGKTQDDMLIKVFVLPTTRGTVDFKKLTIRMTDAEDSSNYVEMSVHVSKWWYHAVFYQAGIPGVSGRAYCWGLPDDPDNRIVGGESGAEIYGSFAGLEDFVADGLNRPFVFSYDDTKKSVHTLAPDGSMRTILKLRDPYCVGAGNEWKGFESGRVTVTVTASDFAASTAQYLITVFDGTSMSGATVTDEKAPALKVSAEFMKTAPQAVVGRQFPLFSAVSDDSVDGAIEDIEVSLTAPDGSVTVLEQDYFIPLATGKHTLTYRAADKAGNATEKSFDITAVMSAPAIELSFLSPMPTDVQVGSRIEVPLATVSGGSGDLTLERTVKRITDGKVCQVKDNVFIPELNGTYAVTYTVTDYLGTQRTFTRYFTAERGNAPICIFPELPKNLIDGKTVKLPAPEAYDYINNPTGATAAVVEVYARYDAGEYEKIDYLFTPDAKKGNSIDIKYRVYCAGFDSAAIVKEYLNILVVQPKQISDYFVKDGIQVTYNKHHIEFAAEASGARMEYINPLSAENFELQFDIPNAKNKFSSLTVTLTDTLTPSQKLTFEIRRVEDSGKSDVYFNGDRYEMIGSFDKSSNPFALIYKNSTRMLKDYDNTGILRADKSGGENFYGFTSGRVYLSIEFGGVSGAAAINLQRLVDQSVYGDYNRQDELVDFTDRTEPLIETAFELSLDAERYQKISLPAANAYDVIDPHVECFVSVVRDGVTILEKTPAESDGAAFYTDGYGVYTVTYSARDQRGNLAEKEYRIRVVDRQPPMIYLLSQLPDSVKTGKKLTVPEALTFDNNSEVTLMIFVIDPYQGMTDITETRTYKFEKAGNYIVRYYAYDADHNYVLREFSIECKGK